MYTFRGLIGGIAMILAMVGCQNSQTKDNGQLLPTTPGTVDLGDRVQLTMSVSLSDITTSSSSQITPQHPSPGALSSPWAGTPLSKALASADENAITKLHVLVFNADNTYAYTAQTLSHTVTGTTLSYTVILNKSTASEQYRPVLLANIDAPTIAPGTMKETALAPVTFTPDQVWNPGQTIPMWADYPNSSIITGSITNAAFGTAVLIRSLARVNVTNVATSTFELTQVLIENIPNKARVAPVLTNFDRNTKKVIAPSPAAGSQITSGVYTVTGNSLVNNIYVGDAPGKALGDPSAVYLVLKGTYGGQTYFYRVDLADGTVPHAILRNHTYAVKVTKVSGPGYGSSFEASISKPINMTATVTVISDSALNDITTDGQYTLAVAGSTMELPGSAGSHSFAFTTDHPNGATVAKGAQDWITITSGLASPVTFTVTENTESAPRQGTITITAGRIAKQVTITQILTPKIGDYYYSDKTFSTALNIPAGETLLGIIYRVERDGKSGMLIDVFVSYPQLEWSNVFEVSGASDKDNGVTNMNTIKQIPNWNTKYPLFTYCDARNTGGINTGWYLPAVYELAAYFAGCCGLRLVKSGAIDGEINIWRDDYEMPGWDNPVHKERQREFNAKLLAAGGTRYDDTPLESSSEASDAKAWRFSPNMGIAYKDDDKDLYMFGNRCVKAFAIP